MKIKDFWNYELEDNNTSTGGVAFDGERVIDFIEEVGISLNEDIEVLNNALNECGIMPIKEEDIIKAKLDKAIDYFTEYTPITELQEHCEWYGVNDIYSLKEVMYESYLDTYTTKEELEERIRLLYE